MDKLNLEILSAYLPHEVKFINIERVYFGGINKDTYSEKRGELAYTNQRVGKIKGYKDGKILTTIGYFKIYEPTLTVLGAHVTHKNERKLLLHPLSIQFLTSIIHHADDMEEVLKAIEDDTLLQIRHDLFTTIVKHHGDVFGLIPLGLAVDKRREGE